MNIILAVKEWTDIASDLICIIPICMMIYFIQK